MVPQKHLKVLRRIYEGLNKSDVSWAVTGSFGFALQGVSVEVHDIDIQTDREEAYEIERLFSEFVIEPVKLKESERIRSHFGALMIEGIKVKIMGNIQKRINCEWEEPVDVNRYRRFVEVEGMKIPVLNLEYGYQAYMKLGKVGMLRRFLVEIKV